MSKDSLSPESIRRAYFSREVDTTQPPSQQSALNELTPSTKYVVREAKKLLGQTASFGRGTALDEDAITDLVRHIEEREAEELSERERTAAVATLVASREDFDVLTPLIENPEINDIIVRSFDDISVQTSRRNIQTDLQFADREGYRSFIENMLKRVGKACTVSTPVVDAAVEPHIRACVTHESFSPPGSGPMLTLRISRHQQITLEGLIQHELAPRIVLDYLGSILEEGQSTVLIAGEVGTGKTTLLRALASRIPEHDAVLVIEDTNEIVLHRKFVRTLLTREPNAEGAGRISPALAIRTGMRMAMNRLFLGEMRDAEAAEAFIDVCASGHAGMSTIHARSAKDALARLELFLLRAQPDVGIETVRRQIANAVSVIIYLGVDRSWQQRRLLEALEVGTFADGTIQYSPIFSFNAAAELPEWRRDGGISAHDSLLRAQGVLLPLPGEIITLSPEMSYRTYQH